MGSTGEKKLAFTNDSGMSINSKKILLWALFLFGLTLLFLPVRVDHITGILAGNDPSDVHVVPVIQDYYSSALIGFNGHPAGILFLILFALTPFFVVAQSFSVSRPFGFTAIVLLRLEALLMFIGGPYLWYIITYDHGYFSDMKHETSPAIGGWILILYEIVSGILLYTILANPKGKLAQLFPTGE